MNQKLFRSTEFYHRRYHNFATLFIVPCVLFLSFLILFFLFAQKEIIVASIGEVTPIKVVASIQSTSNNPITNNNLINNQLIRKGELVIQYTDNVEKSQKEFLDKQLATLIRQKTGLNTLKISIIQGINFFTEEDEFGHLYRFQNFIAQSQDIEKGIEKINTEVNKKSSIAKNTIVAIDRQINYLQQQVVEYEELRQAIIDKNVNLSVGNPHQATLTNFLSQYYQNSHTNFDSQYLDQINKSISELELSIASLNVQRFGIDNMEVYDDSLETKIEILRAQFLETISQQLLTVETQIADLTSQIEHANVQFQNNTIVAPETGIIHLNHEFEGKNVIPIGDEIAQIFPDIEETKKVLITYYVTSEYFSFLEENQEARLTLEKYGSQTITLIGYIKAIDKTATKTENGNLFKVAAEVSLTDEHSGRIQYGLQGRVTSVIAKKTYFDYYKDKILSNFN